MIKAKGCQNLFDVVTKNANEIGMKVNKEKTQLNNTETPQLRRPLYVKMNFVKIYRDRPQRKEGLSL